MIIETIGFDSFVSITFDVHFLALFNIPELNPKVIQETIILSRKLNFSGFIDFALLLQRWG